MVFTATLGQEFWRKVIEGTGQEELWPNAYKQQISMFDCQKYEDGSQSRWTDSRIAGAIDRCKNKAEVNRRIYGKFVMSEGLKYSGFDRTRNFKPYPKTKDGRYYKGVPNGWDVYSAVDIGSGGKDNHPAAYSFLAVSPGFDKIRWFRGRRLDGIETIADDIYKYYADDRGSIQPVQQVYDFASKDFGTIVDRIGESWTKANKSHEQGEMILNTALKTGILAIYYDPTDPECESYKLVGELESLANGRDKRICKDDFVDTLRYALASMPIDWEAVFSGLEIRLKTTEETKQKNEWRGADELAREKGEWTRDIKRDKEEEAITQDCESEYNEWNDMY
jgi:hypothetical protein